MIKDIQYSQVSNFESDVQEAKNWDIKIVSYDNLKYGITVIFELNTPKYLR